MLACVQPCRLTSCRKQACVQQSAAPDLVTQTLLQSALKGPLAEEQHQLDSQRRDSIQTLCPQLLESRQTAH